MAKKVIQQEGLPKEEENAFIEYLKANPNLAKLLYGGLEKSMKEGYTGDDDDDDDDDDYDCDYDDDDDDYDEYDYLSTGEWSDTHLAQISCPSDRFYTDLVNEMLDDFMALGYSEGEPAGFELDVAMAIVAYLEDFVSETKVWSTMRSLYRERYGRWLPFYDCSGEDYYEDDLNIEDVKFIVWQTISRAGQEMGKIYWPHSRMIEAFAQFGYKIICDNVEEAPVAHGVAQRLRNLLSDGDYPHVRMVGLWLSVYNRLTAHPEALGNLYDEATDLADAHPNITQSSAMYQLGAQKSWAEAVGMIGCSSAELVAALARAHGYEKTAQMLDTVKVVGLQKYAVKSLDRKKAVVEDARGEEYELDRRPFDADPKMQKCRTLSAELVKYGDLWRVNGLVSHLIVPPTWEPSDLEGYTLEELIKVAKEKIKSKRGRRVFYFNNIEEISEFMGLEGFVDTYDFDDSNQCNVLLLLSETEPPMVLGNVAEIFNDTINPFYNPNMPKDMATGLSFGFFLFYSVADDVAEYIERKKLLSYAAFNTRQNRRAAKALIQDNMRFFLNFYRVK